MSTMENQFCAADAAKGNIESQDLNFYGEPFLKDTKELVRLPVTSDDLMAYDESVQSEALRMAEFLHEEEWPFEVGRRLSMSPTLHRLVEQCANGTTTFQEIVAICYMAGRISVTYLKQDGNITHS